MTFAINEIFTSIQGEGRFTGLPCHFIRFQGCNLRCSFCDTPRTWHRGPHEAEQVLLAEELYKHLEGLIRRYPAVQDVVLTGGEPLYQNGGLLGKEGLFYWLWDHGLSVHIETNGTVIPPAMEALLDELPSDRIFITISPKTNQTLDIAYMPVQAALMRHHYQIKFPIGHPLDVEFRIPAFLDRYGKLNHVYLQPVEFHGDPTRTQRAKELAFNYALKTGFSISAQVHKMLGVR